MFTSSGLTQTLMKNRCCQRSATAGNDIRDWCVSPEAKRYYHNDRPKSAGLGLDRQKAVDGGWLAAGPHARRLTGLLKIGKKLE